MKILKSIDGKSFAIGALAFALVMACSQSPNPIVNDAEASTGKYAWDQNQEWEYKLQLITQESQSDAPKEADKGWEPFSTVIMTKNHIDFEYVVVRRRIK